MSQFSSSIASWGFSNIAAGMSRNNDSNYFEYLRRLNLKCLYHIKRYFNIVAVRHFLLDHFIRDVHWRKYLVCLVFNMASVNGLMFCANHWITCVQDTWNRSFGRKPILWIIYELLPNSHKELCHLLRCKLRRPVQILDRQHWWHRKPRKF